MENVFDPVVLAMAAAGVTYVVDMLGAVPSWVKVIASYVVSTCFVFGAGADVVAQAAGNEPGIMSSLLSGLLLAGVSSKVIHPIKESLRIGNVKDEG